MAEVTHLLNLPLKHKPKDIKPQGAGSTLDADMVDGKHASELGGGPHVITHVKGGSDPFDGTTHQISFQFEQVATLPSPTLGRVIVLLTDGHVYVGV
jgi:hypothetical protein